MKKLRSKILLTIYTILTISITVILIIYNTNDYIREYNNINNNLNKMTENDRVPPKNNDKHLPPEEPINKDKRFMDVNIYTIIISNNKINEVISHTNEETIPNKVLQVANKILNKEKRSIKYIGNLYNTKYSYNYIKGKSIVIMDITDTNKKLNNNLLISLIIFIIFEIIAYIISSIISSWIIKPVEVSFKRQKQFISDASHELKTPLSVIIASSEAYENDHNKKWLNNIKTESVRMSNLIKDLLDLSKMENDEIKRVYERNNISKLIEKTILPLESLIYEKNLKLDYVIVDNIYMNSISTEIKQLVTILMDNAIKHSKKEGIIKLTFNKKKDKLILKVINEGDSIPKGEEEKIFERFYRVDKARNRDENRYGLGLAIAKSITERHNGTIKAYSKDNITTFEVIFNKK